MSSVKSDYINNWIFRANEDISVINSLVKSGTEFYTSTIIIAVTACHTDEKIHKKV